MQDQPFMSRALDLAREAAQRDEVPVGAVLVLDGQIIAEGSNQREETKRTTAHAEIQALENYSKKNGQWRLPPGTSLFVTVEPCLMCTGALLWARLDNLYYGCSDSKNAGLERVRSLIEAGIYDHKFSEIHSGILAETCGGLMTVYFKKKRELKRAPS